VTRESEMAAWCLAHPKRGLLVRVRCPRSKACCVAELQATPGGLLLKVYQRETKPRVESDPIGPPDDLSHHLASPAVQYLEEERRARKRYLRERGEVPAWDRTWLNSFQAYSADGLPDDWQRTMVCSCEQGILTGEMLNAALRRGRHAASAVVIRFQTGTR